MKYFAWSYEKNDILKKERGISFEEILFHIEKGDLLAVVQHANPEKYPGQRMMIVNVNGYAYLVPFMESEREIFLKTIISSRKATRDYLRRNLGRGETKDE